MMRVTTWANLSPTPSATATKPKPIYAAGEPFSGAGNCHFRPSKCSTGGAGSGPIWSMSSLMEVLPDSPSPICSSPRTSSVATTMDFCNGSNISSEFFTPRDQKGSPGMIKFPAPKGEAHGSVPERRELLYFLHSDSDFNCLKAKENWKQESNSPTRQSMSTLYESTLTTMDQQDSNPCLGNPRKCQTLHHQELTCEKSSSGKATRSEEDCTRLARPRPYQEFLDEVQTQQNGAEIEAWKKAQQLQLQNKLRRKEAAITNWEMEQKNKARAEMELIERKMEMKRAKALKKMQQKIVEANKAAEKQRDRERRSALKKMAKVARLSEKIQSTKCMICLKLQNLC